MDRILLVDDDRDFCEAVSHLLRKKKYEVVFTTSPLEALKLVAEQDFDAVVTDVGMPELSGLELCERLLGIRQDVPVVVVTGNVNLESAVAAIRAGAYDFVTKPIDPELLTLQLARCIRNRKLQLEVKRLSDLAPARPAIGLGGSNGASLKSVEDLVGRVAHMDISVLIQGETGTGKEVVARAIHAASRRCKEPFVAINCAAVAPSLLESELFGHERGAFTDAKNARDGLFVQASGGTLFLDEIGEMPLEMQPKLLRALQERTVRPVGSDTDTPFDARIIAATHRELEAEVAAGRFREDLFYRVNVVTITVPPLRGRGEDLLLLADHFLRAASARHNKGLIKIAPRVASMLQAYDWPGNVRELENAIECAVALARFDYLSAEDLPERIRLYERERPASVAPETQEILPLEEIDRRYILHALKVNDGNKARTADLLQIDRRTLYRRLERYEAQERSEAAPPDAHPLSA